MGKMATIVRKITGKSRIVGLLLILTSSVCFCLFFGPYFSTKWSPHYITLPIQPPDGFYGRSTWLETTYSIRTVEEFPLINPRVYLWRRWTYVPSDHGQHVSDTWQTIISYFDDNLSRLGWVRSEDYDPCSMYLPEAGFLDDGPYSYVHYFRKGYERDIVYGKSYNGDVICLAVWASNFEDGGLPDGFYIVLLTARQSISVKIMNIFSG